VWGDGATERSVVPRMASLPYCGGTLQWTNLLERQSIAAHEIFNDPFVAFGQVVYRSVLAR
jgi:hypothetical protein